MREVKLKDAKTLEVDRREAANDEPYTQDILQNAELSEIGLDKTPIALDTETTDTKPTYAQILTCCFIVLQRLFLWRSRLRPGQLISPGAMITNRLSWPSLNDPNLPSNYLVMRSIHGLIKRLSNCLFFAYNMPFDDRFLANELYKNGFSPWVLKQDNNQPFDALNLLKADNCLNHENAALRPKMSDGNYSFSLENIFGQNDLETDGNFHDVRSDTKDVQTVFAELCKNPVFIPLINAASDKNGQRRKLVHGNYYISFNSHWKTGAKANPAVALCMDSVVPNRLIRLSLTTDMMPGDVASGELLRHLQTRKGRNLIGTVKPNGGEILLHQDDPLIDRLFSKEIQQKFSEIGRLAKNDLAIRQEAQKILQEKADAYPEPVFTEEKMISGGFYSPEDLRVANAFHRAPPDEKLKFRDAMTDERLRHFCTRVLYDNWPSSLPAKEIKSIAEEIAWRLTTEDNVPWLTIDKVLNEIDIVLPTCDSTQEALLKEYQTYLNRMRLNPIQKLA